MPRLISAEMAMEIAQAEYDYWKQFQDSDNVDEFMSAVVGMGASANILASLLLGRTPQQHRDLVRDRQQHRQKQTPTRNETANTQAAGSS